MTMLGVMAGGLSVARFGIVRSLVAGALLGPVTGLVFAWLATRGNDVTALVVVTAIESVLAGFAGTCLVAYMSSLTSAGFTATQYAFLSSVSALPGRLLASQSGRIVEGAAAAAGAGGILSRFEPLFIGLPPGSFASGVSPAALRTGYVVFFLYSALLGLFVVVLAFAVVRRQTREQQLAQRAP
jgi:PAT family beta-lactamase induction signal transducer AmpG